MGDRTESDELSHNQMSNSELLSRDEEGQIYDNFNCRKLSVDFYRICAVEFNLYHI